MSQCEGFSWEQLLRYLTARDKQRLPEGEPREPEIIAKVADDMLTLGIVAECPDHEGYWLSYATWS